MTNRSEIRVYLEKSSGGKTVLRITGRFIPEALKNEIISDLGVLADYVEVNQECNTSQEK